MRSFITIVEGTGSIEDIIDSEVSKTGMEPIELNDGWCDFFADKVVNALGGPSETTITASPRDQVVIERLGQTYDPTAPLHYFVLHDGQVYDAEAPDGVDRWQELPFYQRHSW